METKKHTYSEQEAYIKLSALCASAEYCEYDLRRKARNWDTPLDSIITRLRNERFIDDSRYAHAFVRDKFRYNHWGQVRISQELRMRHISQDIIDDALQEIEEEDNLSTLRKLIDSKRKSVKGKSEYEINSKLIRFALGRGFQMDDILQILNSSFTSSTFHS